MLQVNYHPLRLASTSLFIVFLVDVGSQKYTSGAKHTANQGNFTHNFKVILMLIKKNGFQNWHFVLPEDATPVPKRVGDAPLIFVLKKTTFSWCKKLCISTHCILFQVVLQEFHDFLQQW